MARYSLQTFDRLSGASRDYSLPEGVVVRALMYWGSDLYIAGGVVEEAFEYEYAVGDYTAVQPPDVRDEPGVDQWPSGGTGVVNRTTYSPRMWRLVGSELHRVGLGGSFGTPFGGWLPA